MPDPAAPLVEDGPAPGTAEGDVGLADERVVLTLGVARGESSRERILVDCDPYTTYEMTAATRSEMSRLKSRFM